MAGLDRYWKNRVMMIKPEVTAGVDAIPTSALNSMLAFNVSLTFESDEKTREPDKGYYANPEKTYTNKRCAITFDIEMAGSGTAGTIPKIAPIFKMCGWREFITALTSVEYLPTSSSTETATIYFNIDGTLFKTTSCKGSLKFSPAINDYNKGSVTVTGLYLTPVDAALVPGVFTGFEAPVDCTEETCELSINGTLVDGVSLNFDQGNENKLQQSTQTKLIANTNRQSTSDVAIWINDQADFNPFPLFENHTKVPIVWTSGIVAGNIVTYSMPQAQLGTPNPQDYDGAAGYAITLTPHSTAAGDDEMSVMFT